MSPGWQLRALQMASSVEKRMALALPVFRMERLAGVRSMVAASSLSDILRRAIITSRFTIIGITLSFFSLFFRSFFSVGRRHCLTTAHDIRHVLRQYHTSAVLRHTVRSSSSRWRKPMANTSAMMRLKKPIITEESSNTSNKLITCPSIATYCMAT